MCNRFDSQSGNQTPVYPVAEKPVALFSPVGVCRRGFLCFKKGIMKQTVLIFLLAILVSSCSMEKRLYRDGWYLQTNKKTECVKTKSVKPARDKQIETSIQKPLANDLSRVEIVKTETANLFEPDLVKPFYKIHPPDSVRQEEKIKKKKGLKPLSIKTVDVKDNGTVGIARSIIALTGLGFIIWLCVLGSPFIWFAIPLAFFVTLCAVSSVMRLAELSSWNADSSFDEKAYSVFLACSMGIAYLFIPFTLLIIIIGYIYVTVANNQYRKQKKADKK